MSKPRKRPHRRDYDSPWKELLVEHFEVCMLYFFPDVHALIDWARRREFLDKELRAISRGAKSGKRVADVLVKVWLKDGTRIRVIVHVEVQSRRETNFPARMFQYHYRAYDLDRTPVVSLAILADANPDWRPDRFAYDHAGGGIELRFHVCKLIDFRAREDELWASKDPFARVILAILKTLDTVHDPERRKEWKFKFTTELQSSGLPTKYVDSVLNVLDGYMVLPDNLSKRFELDMQEFERNAPMRFVSTFERIGRREGLEEGMRKGERKGERKGRREGHVESTRDNIVVILRRRLGAIPTEVRKALNDIENAKKLKELLLWAATAESFDGIPLSEHAAKIR